MNTCDSEDASFANVSKTMLGISIESRILQDEVERVRCISISPTVCGGEDGKRTVNNEFEFDEIPATRKFSGCKTGTDFSASNIINGENHRFGK